jgi:dephospho-CoA kinase
MYIIGITGGIGTGKSRVSHIVEKHGGKIIDADIITREMYTPGSSIIDKICDYFGRNVLNTDGSLNKKILANIVFNDKDKLLKLNEITHPEISRIIKLNLNKLISEDYHGLVVIDAALPFKEGFLDLCNEVWVITAPLELRIDRLKIRSGFTREEALERINSQLSLHEYNKIATKIINNDSNETSLEKKVIASLHGIVNYGGKF